MRTSFLPGKWNLSICSRTTTCKFLVYSRFVSLRNGIVQRRPKSSSHSWIKFLSRWWGFDTILVRAEKLGLLSRSLRQVRPWSLAQFRFRKRDVFSLGKVLDILETIPCDQRSICSGIEGLCVLFRRLSYPGRCRDMIQRFAKPVPIFMQHGYEHLDWFHICYPWSTVYPVESWHVRGNHDVERFTFTQLFWIYRWHRTANCTTRIESVGCAQWTHAGPCPKVPVRCFTKW